MAVPMAVPLAMPMAAPHRPRRAVVLAKYLRKFSGEEVLEDSSLVQISHIFGIILTSQTPIQCSAAIHSMAQ